MLPSLGCRTIDPLARRVRGQGMAQDLPRPAYTLVELLVVLGILAVLLALLLPAVQAVRASAARSICSDHLRQIGLALHGYEASNGVLPPGVRNEQEPGAFPFLSWQARLLPFLEQQALWAITVQAFALDGDFRDDPPHLGFATVLPVFTCPVDARTQALGDLNGLRVAFTDYLGVAGVTSVRGDGIFYLNSHVRFSDITDGTTNTLAVGERPPSADGIFGWWYGGMGQSGNGSADMLLGVREKCYLGYYGCPMGPYEYGPGDPMDNCAMFHFYSQHKGGAYFLFADGSVHFLPYSARPVMKALATRAGGEVVDMPF
jgi:prepilin-type N-terminal cleavage/methylation domain-containing protein/prepilin-type processing-associated H-X9-DG protein